jgi:hypothetical protein
MAGPDRKAKNKANFDAMKQKAKDKKAKIKANGGVNDDEFDALKRKVGEKAGEISHDIIIKQCKDAGITVPRVLREIASALNAKEVKATYAQTEGAWRYSKQLKAWPICQKAVDQAISILGIKAPEKQDVDLKTNIPTMLVLSFEEEKEKEKEKE